MINFIELSEDDFRKTVIQAHIDGHFRGDPHTMNTKFKRSKRTLDFISVEMRDVDNNLLGFCGLDVFETRFGIKGKIHCLGVPKSQRRNNYAYMSLIKVEEIALSRHDIVEILSTCNPISEKVHHKAGYVTTNPGRLSPTGKIMQIRLSKYLKK